MCKTRWLSSDMAVTAMMSEIIAVWSTLEHFANERNDAVAIGTLHLCREKTFVQVLYLLSAVLPHLTSLSLIFQGDQLNFAQVSASVACCNNAITGVREDQVVVANLERDWHLFADELGELSEKDRESTKRLTTAYCNALLDNLKDRFPEPEIVSAFIIFDPGYCPEKREERQKYGERELQILLDRFGDLLSDPERVKINWPAFVERLLMEPLSKCKGAAQVCGILGKDSFYKEAFPDIQKLATIALTIPLSTCWPERGFSSMLRIKSKSRNRLLDELLCALMSISINGPAQLDRGEAETIANKWLDKKRRRSVTERGTFNLQKLDRQVALSSSGAEDNICDDEDNCSSRLNDEVLTISEIEMDSFFL